ncbi:uncharacterized protein METZ01_LOCUS457936 [marine metagenome]|uniref:Uncharacterized protein n=1 Tax=marine metagenome TaxID=408172 RepID=A0A383ABJ2_9ZZZZ
MKRLLRLKQTSKILGTEQVSMILKPGNKPGYP